MTYHSNSIYSVSRHELLMDFSGINTKYKPSDVDMFYIGKNFVILGEIKHYKGEFTKTQRDLYQELATFMVYKDVLVLYIVHDEKVEDGAERVDIGNCYVAEYLFKPKHDKNNCEKPIWKKAPPFSTVNDIITGFIQKENKKLEKNK